MARKLTTDHEIDAFILRVIGEAQRPHGRGVCHVIQPLSDEVRKRLNLKIDMVEVYERNGNLARTCWVTIQGARYVFSFNSGTRMIELRDHSLQGAKRFEFDNATSLPDIQSEVGKL
jgi:integron cassette protein